MINIIEAPREDISEITDVCICCTSDWRTILLGYAYLKQGRMQVSLRENLVLAKQFTLKGVVAINSFKKGAHQQKKVLVTKHHTGPIAP